MEMRLLYLAHWVSWPSDATVCLLVASARDCGTDWELQLTGREDWMLIIYLICKGSKFTAQFITLVGITIKLENLSQTIPSQWSSLYVFSKALMNSNVFVFLFGPKYVKIIYQYFVYHFSLISKFLILPGW